MKIRTAWVLLALSAAGCASMKDCVDEWVIRVRNCRCSNKAWRDYRYCVGDIENRKHFERGFKDGYRAVANGGSRCQPALPPECYWRFCHESAEGQADMVAWFNGYSHGALVADQQGIAEASRIVIAPTITPPTLRRRPPPPPDFGPPGAPGPLPADCPPEGPPPIPTGEPTVVPRFDASPARPPDRP